MAIIEINLTPSKRELNWFGLILFVFFSLFGTILFSGFNAQGAAYMIWTVGGVVALVYYFVPPLRRLLYLCWMYAVLPIGWTISHLLLAFIYYLLITPIGWIMRLFGRDMMQRKFNTGVKTYWVEHQTDPHPSRYFKQF